MVPRNRSTYKLGVTMLYSSFKSFRSWYTSKQKKSGELVIDNTSGTPVLALQLRGLLVSSTTWSTISRTGSAAITFDSIATH